MHDTDRDSIAHSPCDGQQYRVSKADSDHPSHLQQARGASRLLKCQERTLQSVLFSFELAYVGKLELQELSHKLAIRTAAGTHLAHSSLSGLAPVPYSRCYRPETQPLALQVRLKLEALFPW